MMVVGDILKKKGSEVITARPDESVGTVLGRFYVHKIGALVVIGDDGELLGLLTERDLVGGLISYGGHVVDSPVRQVMSRNVPVCRLNDRVTDIMQMMTAHRTRHLPVIENGKLCGLVSIGDAVKYRLDDVELENTVLRDLARSRH